MNPANVWLVVAQEFRIRLRTGRWRWLLGAWLALLALFTLLLDLGLKTGYSYVPDDSLRGVPLFGFLMFWTVCATAQALSALLARSITSALLSYVVTMTLAVGTLVAFALALPLTEERMVITNRDGYQYTVEQSHPERVWWLLAPNPFVILADAAPRVPPRITRTGQVIEIEHYDPLSMISNEVRQLRSPDYWYVYAVDVSSSARAPAPEDKPVWPYGLGFAVLLGAASLGITTYRLRTPTDRLPRGVRVA
jgi:hypothetical protein